MKLHIIMTVMDSLHSVRVPENRTALLRTWQLVELAFADCTIFASWHGLGLANRRTFGIGHFKWKINQPYCMLNLLCICSLKISSS